MTGADNIINDKVGCVAYDNRGKFLLAGTKDGRILIWKNLMMGVESPLDSDQWKPLHFMQLEKSVLGISVGRSNGLFAVRTTDSLKIIQNT